MATAPNPLAALMQQIASRGGPPGLPGALPGGPPPPPPPPVDVASIVAQVSAMPSPFKEQTAMRMARELMGIAMTAIHMRSPQVAKELSSALVNLQQARVRMGEISEEPVGPPTPGLPTSGSPIGDAGNAGLVI